jgi:hypothetical protein
VINWSASSSASFKDQGWQSCCPLPLVDIFSLRPAKLSECGPVETLVNLDSLVLWFLTQSFQSFQFPIYGRRLPLSLVDNQGSSLSLSKRAAHLPLESVPLVSAHLPTPLA